MLEVITCFASIFSKFNTSINPCNMGATLHWLKIPLHCGNLQQGHQLVFRLLCTACQVQRNQSQGEINPSYQAVKSAVLTFPAQFLQIASELLNAYLNQTQTLDLLKSNPASITIKNTHLRVFHMSVDCFWSYFFNYCFFIFDIYGLTQTILSCKLSCNRLIWTDASHTAFAFCNFDANLFCKENVNILQRNKTNFRQRKTGKYPSSSLSSLHSLELTVLE